MKTLMAAAAAVATLFAVPGLVMAQVGGNLAATPSEPIELALTGEGPSLSETTFELITGDYYRLTITSDGSEEALFTAPDLFQNVWMNQIVVEGVEIKLRGGAAAVGGVEVGEDGPGSVTITFVPIRPGEYAFWIDEEAGIGGTFIVE